MSYTPTNWANGKAPALNADNLNKIEEELAKLDKDVSSLAEVVAKPDTTETTSPTMPNSYSGRLKVEEIGGGESQQNTTSGKNLLDCSGLTTTTTNGVTFTPVYAENGALVYVNVNGTATADTYHKINAFTFSQGCIVNGCPSGGSVSTYFVNVSQHSNDYGSGTTVDDGQEHVVYIGIKSGYNATNLRFYPMVRLASITDATYEPFTNGASPNPSYPQEIKKTVVSEIRTHGKNLFDISKAVSGYITNDGAFTTHTSLMLSDYMPSNGNVTVSTSKNARSIAINCFDSNKAFISKKIYENCAVATHGAVSNCAYVRVAFNPTDTDTNTDILSSYSPMVNAGSTALPYEPYTESVITLSQPIELYGIGDVMDVIDVENGKVIRNYGVATENNFTHFSSGGSVSGGGLRWFDYNTNSLAEGNAYCTHLMKLNYPWNSTVPCIAIDKGRIRIYDDSASVSEFGTKYAGLKFVYQLATPVIEDLPIADQIALNSLSTYDGITYLEFDSEIEPTFKGEYGTSKVGGYTLEGMLAGRNGELYGSRINALEASVVNNI